MNVVGAGVGAAGAVQAGACGVGTLGDTGCAEGEDGAVAGPITTAATMANGHVGGKPLP